MKGRNAMLCAVASAVASAVALIWAGGAAAAPSATVTPALLAPTQTITVGATGFAANEVVDVYFDTTDLALASTDGTGAITGFAVTVPSTAAPGNHWLTLDGRRDGLSAQKLVTIHTGWVTRGWSAFDRGLNPFENVISQSNVRGLEEDWTFNAGSVTFGSPAIGSGSRTAIYGDESATVHAVNEVTGASVWTVPVNGPVESTPAIDSGKVYVTQRGADVIFALNATTGAFIWSQSIGNPNNPQMWPPYAYSSPVVVNHVVYVGSYDDQAVYALDANTGNLLWRGPTGGPVSGSPTVSGGRVFVDAYDSVYAFSVGCATGGANCTPLWTTSLDGSGSNASPVVSNGVVYTAAGGLYALNAITGALMWKGTLGAYADLNSPAIANGVVYVSSNTPAELYAFPASCGTGGATCSPLWRSASIYQSESSPAIANGVVYIAGTSPSPGYSGVVMGFRASASCANPCAPLWTGSVSQDILGSPIVSDGEVLSGFTNGNETVGGLVAWDLPAATRTPVVKPDPKILKPDLSLRPAG